MVDTHYFTRPPILDRESFEAFASDVRKLIVASPSDCVLCGPDGTGEPELTADYVAFNGSQERGKDHEPLVIERVFSGRQRPNGVCFAFVETMGKPYDRYVVASLYAFIYRFPSCKFTSDSKENELQPGFDLFLNVCDPKCDALRLMREPLNR